MVFEGAFQNIVDYEAAQDLHYQNFRVEVRAFEESYGTTPCSPSASPGMAPDGYSPWSTKFAGVYIGEQPASTGRDYIATTPTYDKWSRKVLSSNFSNPKNILMDAALPREKDPGDDFPDDTVYGAVDLDVILPEFPLLEGPACYQRPNDSFDDYYLEQAKYNASEPAPGTVSISHQLVPSDLEPFFDDDSIYLGQETYKWYEPVYFTGTYISGEPGDTYTDYYVYVRYREMSPQPPPP